MPARFVTTSCRHRCTFSHCTIYWDPRGKKVQYLHDLLLPSLVRKRAGIAAHFVTIVTELNEHTRTRAHTHTHTHIQNERVKCVTGKVGCVGQIRMLLPEWLICDHQHIMVGWYQPNTNKNKNSWDWNKSILLLNTPSRWPSTSFTTNINQHFGRWRLTITFLDSVCGQFGLW